MTSRDFRIGIQELDSEHERFVAMLQDLQRLRDAGEPAQALLTAVEELDWYITQHFAREHRLMEEHAYPHTETHRREHDRFRRHIETLREEVERSESELLEVLIGLLERWFMQHVQGSDRVMGEFLKRHGVT